MPRIELCELWVENLQPAMANQPKQEPTVEAASVPWFIHFMRLNSHGLTPTVTPTGDMPSRVAVAQFLGPKHSSGYIVDDQGMPEYESHVCELFRRVLQVPWPGYSPLSKADSANAWRVLSNPEANKMSTTPSPNAVTARPIGLDLSGGRGKDKQVELLPATRPSEPGECSRKGNRTINEAAALGIILLRPSFNGVVEAERKRFMAARHDIGKPLHNLRSETAEDKERLKFLERKVAEKTGSYERASEEYGQERDLYAAARFELGQPASRDQKTALKRMTKISENLVASCFANLEGANTRLASWEFKRKRQNERIGIQSAELLAAEKVYAEKLMILENSLVHIEAVAIVLADL